MIQRPTIPTYLVYESTGYTKNRMGYYLLSTKYYFT